MDLSIFQSISFNNREIAVGIWLGIFILWCQLIRDIRKAVQSVLGTFLHWRIQLPLWVMFGYMAVAIYGLQFLRFWDVSALKDTILWLVCVALVLLFRAHKVNANERPFRDSVIENLKLIAILEFVSNAYTFSLPVELVMIPIMTWVVLLKVVVEIKLREEKNYELVDTLLWRLMVIYGATVFGISLWQAVHDLNGFVTIKNLRDFLLPLALSVFYLPFLYLWALFLMYENVFVRIDVMNEDKKLARHLKRVVLMSFHLKLDDLHKWSRRVLHLRITSLAEAVDLVRK